MAENLTFFGVIIKPFAYLKIENSAMTKNITVMHPNKTDDILNISENLLLSTL